MVDDEEDVLDTGRRRLPRWATALIALLVIAVVVALLVVNRHAAHHPQAKRTPSVSPSSPSPVPTITRQGAQDLLLSGSRLYVLAHGLLYEYDVTQRDQPAIVTTQEVSDLDLTAIGASHHLLLDRPDNRLWVVTFGQQPAAVVGYDATTLQRLRPLTMYADVTAAAVLDGHLYLAPTQGLYDVSPQSVIPTLLAKPAGDYFAITADPARHRILLFGNVGKFEFVSYVPSTGAMAVSRSAPFSKGGLTVVDGAIWAGGYGQSGAVLARLDPSTLQPTLNSPLAPKLGPGANIVATGTQDFWVRSGAGGDTLWCVDGRDGRPLQSWQLAGPVTSSTGVAYVAGSTGASRLTLTACRG